MAIVHRFGTLTLDMSGEGEYAVKMEGFHFDCEEEESLEEVVTSIINQIGLELCTKEGGVWKDLYRFLSKELNVDKVHF